MRLVPSAVACALALALATPAAADEPSPLRRGAWIVGGSSYFAMDSTKFEFQEKGETDYYLELSPDLSVFLLDTLALRVRPGFEWQRDESEDGLARSRWFYLDFGPALYVPIASDRLYVVGALGFGTERGTWKLAGKRQLDFSGTRFTGELGLAVPVGTGGLVTLSGHFRQRSLRRTEENVTVDLDLRRVSFGFGYALVL